jgi:predicted anti-sigma-YlaC factor YlaD
MSHPSERQLVDHARQRLFAEEARQVAAHLLTCAPCQERADQLADLWRILGSSDPSAPARDFTADILARLPQDTPQRRRWEYARIAAAIVLAVGLGHIAARTLRTPAPPPPPDAAAVAETLGLEALADAPDLDLVLQLAYAEEGVAQ